MVKNQRVTLLLVLMISVFASFVSATTFNGGKIDRGTGSYYQWEDEMAIWGLQFDTYTDIELKSVKIYNGVSDNGSYIGDRVITVINSKGDTIASKTVNITADSVQRLELNIQIPAGSGYRLLSDRHLGYWRDNTGASYPYAIGTVASITSGTRFDGFLYTDGYHFFYDWEVEACPVITSFSYDKDEYKVVFNNSTIGATSYLWDFGDNSTSVDENPEHIYQQEGVYTVILKATNGDCSMQVEKKISVKEKEIQSLSDYDFIGDGYGILTDSSQSSVGVQKPYVPNLTDLVSLDVLYVSPSGIGDGFSEVSPTTIQEALKGGAKNTVIVALDGDYTINKLELKNINNVHIIAKNKHKAIIKLTEDGQNFQTANDNVEVHNLSFIGFKAEGNGERPYHGSNYFLFGPGNGIHYHVYNIYFSDMDWSNYIVTLYGGLHSHDWTIDKSLYHNSSGSYIWYMMGWHHTVMNTVMYDGTYLSLAIRGCYPPDEAYIYGGQNTLIADRTGGHFLAENDWTHLIINNTFGSNYDYSRENEAHMAVWYDTPGDEQGKAEDCYFPPKNIVIANNVFIDKGKTNKYPIKFAASRGINDPNIDNVASVNGVTIINNYTDKKVVVEPYESTDLSSVDLSTNVAEFTDFGFDDDNRDYSISRNSGLVNKGTTKIYVPNVDNQGKLRDSTPDVGAYEAISDSLLKLQVRKLVKMKIGQSRTVTLYDGTKTTIKLLDVIYTRDKIRKAIREAKIQLEVDGTERWIVAGTYHLPDTIGNVKIDCPFAKEYLQRASYPEYAWRLGNNDVILRVWPVDKPVNANDLVHYQVYQKWGISNSTVVLEPVEEDGDALHPNDNDDIYYHWGIDIVGVKNITPVLAAGDGVVISVGNNTNTNEKFFKDGIVSPRFERIFVKMDNGWVYRYSHLDDSRLNVTLGQRVKGGDPIAYLSDIWGGFSHCHFEIWSLDEDGEYVLEPAYPYVWESYMNIFKPKLIAVARPHKYIAVGDSVKLDGLKSVSFEGEIVKYEWTFQDGTTATGAEVYHKYNKPGYFSEQLKITDDKGNVAYETVQVMVVYENKPNQNYGFAMASYFPSFDNKTGEEITFKGRMFNTQTDGNWDYSEETWDFGDGTQVTSYSEPYADGNHIQPNYATMYHTYDNPGHYVVTYSKAYENETITSTIKLNVDVRQANGVKLLQNKEFDIYPIPTTGDLNIALSENYNTVSITVYSLVGAKIQTYRITNPNDIIKINLSHLQKGVYICNVIADNKEILKSKKIIIK